MIAVIATGGKQYIIKEGSILNVEKLSGNKGDKIVFDQVLLVGTEPAQNSATQNFQSDKGGEVRIGSPTVPGAKVEAEILEQGRGNKVMVIKYKRKVRYRRKVGHRQAYTKVRIQKISA